MEVPERDEVRRRLQMLGIATGIHYPTPVHLQPAYAALGQGRGSFPVAERFAAATLSLPIYPELTSRAGRAGGRGAVQASGSGMTIDRASACPRDFASAPRLVAAVHGRQSMTSDPEYEVGLAAALAIEYDLGGLLELYRRHTTADGYVDRLLRRAAIRALARRFGHGITIVAQRRLASPRDVRGRRRRVPRRAGRAAGSLRRAMRDRRTGRGSGRRHSSTRAI